MHFSFLIAMIATFILPFAYAHSHVECVDLAEDGTTCRGYARHYSTYKRGHEGTPESQDRNFLVSQGEFRCPLPPSGDEYTSEYPQATVSTDQQVTMQWPPRGHAGQPHSDVWVYCLQGADQRIEPADVFRGDTTQETVSTQPGTGAQKTLTRVGTMPYATQCVGSDVSWARCTGEFGIPADWTPGQRSCMWVWELNGGQRYVDCFDMTVQAGGADEGKATSTPVPANSTQDVTTLLPKIEFSEVKQVLSELDQEDIRSVVDDVVDAILSNPRFADKPETRETPAVGGGEEEQPFVPFPETDDSTITAVAAASALSNEAVPISKEGEPCPVLHQMFCAKPPANDNMKHVCEHLNHSTCDLSVVCSHLRSMVCVSGRRTPICHQVTQMCDSNSSSAA